MTVKEFKELCFSQDEGYEIYIFGDDLRHLATICLYSTEFFYSMDEFPIIEYTEARNFSGDVFRLSSKMLKKVGDKENDILKKETLDTLLYYFSKESSQKKLTISLQYNGQDIPTIDFFYGDNLVGSKFAEDKCFENAIKAIIEDLACNPNYIKDMYLANGNEE